MKKFTRVALLFLPGLICAHLHTADSHRNILNSGLPDTSQVSVLLEIADQLRDSSATDSALVYARHALTLSGHSGLNRERARCYVSIAAIERKRNHHNAALVNYFSALKTWQMLGDVPKANEAYHSIAFTYQTLGNYSDALKYLFVELKSLESGNDTALLCDCLQQIAFCYMSQSNYPNSLEYYFKELRIAEANQNRKIIADVHSGLGFVYLRLADYPKALNYFQSALSGYKMSDNKKGIAGAFRNIGNVYYLQGDAPKAKDFALKALALYKEMNSKSGLFVALGDLGLVYADLDDNKAALNYYIEALQLAREMEDKNGMAGFTGNIGRLYMQTKNYPAAETYLLEGLALSHEMHAGQYVKQIESYLSELDSSRGNYLGALAHYRQFIVARDSIENESNLKKEVHAEMAYEFDKKETIARSVQEKKEIVQRNIRNSIGGVLAGSLVFLTVIYRQRNKIAKARVRSDELLLNILPAEVADELKTKGSAAARQYEMVTVMFTDFKNFTAIAADLPAQKLVNEINYCYCRFDEIISSYGLEKIKTIGDSYMCAGGLPHANTTHASDALMAALDIRDFIKQELEVHLKENKLFFDIRIGLHTGPVVAGIVGIKKFAYDIWGDTVNIASRMESSGEAGKINISQATYELVKDHSQLRFEHRGKVEVKNKGMVEMYFAERRELS